MRNLIGKRRFFDERRRARARPQGADMQTCLIRFATASLAVVIFRSAVTHFQHLDASSHWRQPRRGCRGHIPPIFWLGGRQREYPRQYYYVLLDIADQYWLPSVRSASSRFHSAIRRHQFASVRQVDSRLTRLVPPNLELSLTPLHPAPCRYTCTVVTVEQRITVCFSRRC